MFVCFISSFFCLFHCIESDGDRKKEGNVLKLTFKTLTSKRTCICIAPFKSSDSFCDTCHIHPCAHWWRLPSKVPPAHYTHTHATMVLPTGVNSGFLCPAKDTQGSEVEPQHFSTSVFCSSVKVSSSRESHTQTFSLTSCVRLVTMQNHQTLI